MLSLIKKSLRSLATKNILVFTLFCICQMISILSIIFVYGVIVAKNEYNRSFDLGNRTFTVALDGTLDKAGLNDKIESLKADKQLKDQIKNFSLWLSDGDQPVKSDIYFEEASPLYVDAGRYFSKDDYENGTVVILLNQQLAGATIENPLEVGGTYELNGLSYEIIGLFRYPYFEIPYTSLKTIDNSVQISMVLKHCVSESTARQYGRILSDVFDTKAVQLPASQETNTITRNLFQSASAVLIALLAAINFSALYRFLLKKRQAEYSIYRMYGCTKGRGFILLLSELLIVGVGLFIVSSLLFHFGLSWVYPFMMEQITYSLTFMDYCTVLGLYLLTLLLVFIPIIKSYSSKSPADIYRQV